MRALRGMNPENSLTALVLASEDAGLTVKRIALLARAVRIQRRRSDIPPALELKP